MASIVPSTCKQLVQELVDYDQLPSGASADQVKEVCIEKLVCDSKASKESCLKTARKNVNAWFNTTLPEDKVKKPDMTYLEGQTPLQKCTSDCDDLYRDEKIDKSKWELCLRDCYLGKDIPKLIERLDIIEKNKIFRDSLTPWGRLSFKIGLDLMSTGATYKDAFKTWNANTDNTSVPYNDARINSGWQRGVRLALTTDPGLTRANILTPNTLFKFTLFDFTVFGGPSTNTIDGSGVENAMSWTSTKPLTNGKAMEFELQIPVFEENFVEFGSSIYKYDPFWERDSILETHLGLNWQFHGNPITLNERLIDAKGMAYFLSSYAMLGLRVTGSAFGSGRGDSHTFSFTPESYYEASGTKDVGDFCPAVKMKSNEACSSASIVANKGVKDSYGQISITHDDSKIDYQGSFFHLTAQLFGEERGPGGGLAYRFYADYYPTPQKLETGLQLSLYKSLGKAMEFNLEFLARGLTSFADDNAINMIDSGYSVLFRTGMSLKPSAVF